METKDRLNQVIKLSGLRKKDFAEKMKISQAYLSQLLGGTRQPSIQLCKNIENLFDINGEWLKNGSGEMFISKKYKNEVGEFIGRAINDTDNDVYELISALYKLNEEELNAVKIICQALVKKKED